MVNSLGLLVGSGFLVRVGGFLSGIRLFRFRAGLAPRRLSALWFPGLVFSVLFLAAQLLFGVARFRLR